MIYVVRSAAIVDNDLDKCEIILKIGFVEDYNFKAKKKFILKRNPTAQFIYMIPCGDEKDLEGLLFRFNRFLKYGNNWFSNEQEIIDFFDTHTTKESLNENKK